MCGLETSHVGTSAGRGIANQDYAESPSESRGAAAGGNHVRRERSPVQRSGHSTRDRQSMSMRECTNNADKRVLEFIYGSHEFFEFLFSYWQISFISCLFCVCLSLFLCLCVCVYRKQQQQELELRIETQKQTLQSRDESIKKLLEMLQNKGMGELNCTLLFSVLNRIWVSFHPWKFFFLNGGRGGE